MNFSRRDFLRGVSAFAGSTLITRGMFGSSVAFAEGVCTGKKKVVVSIFLSGGPHGPSILVPRGTAQDAYLAKHPTLGISNSLPVDSQHGINPLMPKLHELVTRGKAMVANGGGYPNHSRSHEDSGKLMGFGIVEGGAGAADLTGWAGRYAKNYCSSNEIFSLFSFRGNIAEVKAPGVTAPTGSNLKEFGFFNDSGGSAANGYVRDLLQESRTAFPSINPHQQLMLEGWETAYSTVKELAEVNRGNPGSIAYPGGLGAKLRDAAKLIVAPSLSVQHIFVDQVGYDTHGNQATVLPQLLTNLDESIGAFWADMESRGLQNDVVVLAYGEFGRTHQTAGGGTDHGTGTCMIVVGNNVNGGVGSPAYTTDDFLNVNRPWVDIKFDYREVLEQVLARHQNVDPKLIFPEPFTRIGMNVLRV